MKAIMQNDTDKFLSLQNYSKKIAEKARVDFRLDFRDARDILRIYGMPSKENMTVLQQEDQTTVKFTFHIAKDDKDTIEKAILSFIFLRQTPADKFVHLSPEFYRNVQYHFVLPPNK